MIRRNQAFLNRVNMALDLMIVIAAYLLSSWLRLDFLGGESGNMAAIGWRTVGAAAVYGLGLLFILSMLGFYNTTRTRRLVWKVRAISIATTLAILVVATLLFLFRLEDFSRGVLLAFYLLTLLLLSGKYVLMRLVFSRFRNRGYNLKHVLVVGAGELARQYCLDVAAEPALGFRVRGYIQPVYRGTLPREPEKIEKSQEGPQYLGCLEDLDARLQDINEVVIALEPEEYGRIREVIAICERNGVRYSVIPFYNDIIPANPVIETIGRSKLINMRSNRLENMGWAMLKRGFDLLVSALGLIILSPLLAVIALGVKLSSPGPVLFRQTRVGYERRTFQMLKFRSMRPNPEEETAWSRNADDRRTPFGALLRKTSLDELPQLINVLKGDMSLVGPRPELPHFVEQFRQTVPLYMVKHQVKPGITGWAQVNGYRGDTSIASRIEYDLWYIDNWSVWLDLRILFRTFFGGMINKETLTDDENHRDHSDPERGREPEGAADCPGASDDAPGGDPAH